MNISIHTESKCRGCAEVRLLDAKGDTFEEAELRLHEYLEAEGWTDGLCPDCSQKRFLDPADKADHENKIQRELDP